MSQEKPNKLLWKPLVGYPSYFINRTGEVAHLKRTITFSPQYIILKPQIRSGVKTVILRDSLGKSKSVMVGKAMLSTFYPQSESKRYVIHKDYDKTNCELDNLAWADAKERYHHERIRPKTPKLIQYINGERVESPYVI